jgi:hypothetical protein
MALVAVVALGATAVKLSQVSFTYWKLAAVEAQRVRAMRTNVDVLRTKIRNWSVDPTVCHLDARLRMAEARLRKYEFAAWHSWLAIPFDPTRPN